MARRWEVAAAAAAARNAGAEPARCCAANRLPRLLVHGHRRARRSCCYCYCCGGWQHDPSIPTKSPVACAAPTCRSPAARSPSPSAAGEPTAANSEGQSWASVLRATLTTSSAYCASGAATGVGGVCRHAWCVRWRVRGCAGRWVGTCRGRRSRGRGEKGRGLIRFATGPPDLAGGDQKAIAGWPAFGCWEQEGSASLAASVATPHHTTPHPSRGKLQEGLACGNCCTSCAAAMRSGPARASRLAAGPLLRGEYRSPMPDPPLPESRRALQGGRWWGPHVGVHTVVGIEARCQSVACPQDVQTWVGHVSICIRSAVGFALVSEPSRPSHHTTPRSVAAPQLLLTRSMQAQQALRGGQLPAAAQLTCYRRRPMPRAAAPSLAPAR